MTAQPFFSPAWYRVAALRPRLQPHVRLRRQHFRRRAWYVLEDMAAGKVHRFTAAAWCVIGRFDGTCAVEQAWQQAAAELGVAAPTQEDVVQLLAQLHAADLLQSAVPPDAAELFHRLTSHRRRRLLSAAGSPLSVKLPLLNPEPLLDAGVRLLRPVLGRTGLLLWLFIVAAGLLVAAQNGAELAGALRDRVVAADNWLLTAFVFLVTKIAHELGHGIVARSFGVAVREAGVLMLVLLPSPYMEISRAASLRNRWQRAAIGAAGMAVELLIAALAMFAWVLLEPGFLRAVALDTVMVAGVSTLVFNGNPLLRFDGYYILSDLIEIPNLQRRSNRWWAHLAEHYLFGTDPARDLISTRGERVWFFIYAPSAFVYRLVVLLGVAVVVGGSFFVIGALLAVWAMIVGVLWPIAKAGWHVASSPRLAAVRGRAVAVTGAAVGLMLLVAALVPLPLATTADGVVWLPEEAQQRAAATGFVQRVIATPGSHVERGAPLVEAEDPTLRAQIEAGRARVVELAERVAAARFDQPAEAEALRRELAQETATLQRDEERAARLVLRSSASGRFEPLRAQDLPGRLLREGELAGHVLPPAAAVGRVVVRQDDVALVLHRLDRVEVRIADGRSLHVPTRLLRAVPAATDRLPSRALGSAAGGVFPVDPTDPEGLRALDRLFHLDLELPPTVADAAFGTRLRAKFVHEPEPLASQLVRRARQLFLSRFGV
jgi:putative peptide zinc metalloprotease protein